jgi:hypothetical protein
MKRKCLFPLSIILILIIAGCSSRREYVMPFKNLGYSGERLFPIAENDADFTFRAWVSYSTSIDRVFSISYSKDFGYEGKLLEIQSNNVGKHKEDRTTFKQTNIIPLHGFEKFILKIDSLDLIDMEDQNQDNFQHVLHQPFSLYVIELKSHGKTHHFKFNTYYPVKKEVENKYEEIQSLIFQEFNFKFYFKNN